MKKKTIIFILIIIIGITVITLSARKLLFNNSNEHISQSKIIEKKEEVSTDEANLKKEVKNKIELEKENESVSKNNINIFEEEKIEQYKSLIVCEGKTNEELKNYKDLKIDYGDGESEEPSLFGNQYRTKHIYRKKGKYTITFQVGNKKVLRELNIEEVPINFEDDKLKNALYEKFKTNGIRRKINVFQGIIYPSQAKIIEKLDRYNGKLEGKEIESIKGLKYFTNLKNLSLVDNKINNIDELKYLKKLEKLYLMNNEISNIKPIKNLKNLKIIDLSDNRISDLAPVRELKSLRELTIKNNQNEKLNKIDFSDSKLENIGKIYLDNTNIKEINLGNLGVKNLKLVNSPINDISFLTNLKELESLALKNLDINTLEPLLELNNLKSVTIEIPQLDRFNRETKHYKVIEKLKEKGVIIY